jgi:hypothetical protein
MYRGVYLTSWGNRWQAAIQYGGKRRYLGTYSTQESAARAYDREALSLYGDAARLNFPLGRENLHDGEDEEHEDAERS